MADLELRGVTKTFDGVKALNEVDFDANYGEVLSLLGENGAGKSTLVKYLGGCIMADRGTITMVGNPVKLYSPKDAIKAGIGIVFQELSLIPTLSVADNVFLGRNVGERISLLRKKIIIQKTNVLFRQYEVEDIDPNVKVSSLSLSQRQIVEIIKVLSIDPKIVIFDEATSALTQNKVKWMLNMAKNLAKKGKIVIFISHRMAEIREVCDRVTVFRNGSNVGYRMMQDTNSDELVSLMLGRKMSGYFPEKHSSRKDEVAFETQKLTLKNAFKNINFKLYSGEVVGVGGLAGQGQNALFLSLYGVYKAKGNILINGEIVHIKNPHESLRHGLALVPEDRGAEGLILNLSIKENIILPIINKVTRWGVIDRRKSDELVKQSMDQLRIKADNSDSLVLSLSGGNQQKVVLAKLFLTNPHIILLYDFTRGVDVGTKTEMFKMIKEMASKGNTILFYSTDVEELVNLCDRVMVMHDGSISATLEGDKITQENIILASIGEAAS